MFQSKISIIYIILFLVKTNCFASVNHIDENNMKQGHWVYTNLVKKLPNYKLNQIVEEGAYKNDKKTGKWLLYFENDKIKHILTFTENRPNGYAVFYYKNGKKREEGIWKNNKWVGEYKYYYENGNIRNQWSYNKEGARTGIQKYFFENGQLMIEGEWVDGKKAGTVTEYYEDGSIKSERVFRNGKIDLVATTNYHPKEKLGKVTVIKKNENRKKGIEIELLENSISFEVPESRTVSKDISPWNGTGDHKFFNKKGQVVREGFFVKGYLMDGNVFLYDSEGSKTKTTIFNAGRVVKEINHSKK
jgi:antitoxin component YwqK of YwqJK toxin-antitoxin module